MSIWNGVLQSIHSSLIDELNERFPKDKLELGLPKRFDGWASSPNSETFLFRRVHSAEGDGITALGTLKSQVAADTKKIWEATIVRATKEFGIRKIDARFGDVLEAPPKLSMTIWLPIRIPTTKANPVYDLAVGV